MDEKYREILGAHVTEGMPIDIWQTRPPSSSRTSEVYLMIWSYPVSFVKPIFPHLQVADLLLGEMNMQRTLVTHSTFGVIRCLQRADGHYGVLPSHGGAFQPALCDITSDRSRAR